MRVYHFLKEIDAIDNLKNRHIKIAQIEDLNDPFEMMALDLSNPFNRQAWINMKNDMSKKKGMICFSKKWSNPVMWSHYADRHRGVCLGFDVSDNSLSPIKYKGRRLTEKILDKEGALLTDDKGDLLLNEKDMIDILQTKYASWKYEQEVRMFISLDEKDKVTGLYYFDFNEDLVLREVILGAQRNREVDKIRSLLKHYKNVRLIQSRIAFRTFRIVERKDVTKTLNCN